MAKVIVSQNGIVVNFDKLLAIYVDEELDDDENLLGYNLLGVTSMDRKIDAILLGSYADRYSAMKAKSDFVEWLSNESFSKFEVTPDEGGGE